MTCREYAIAAILHDGDSISYANLADVAIGHGMFGEARTLLELGARGSFACMASLGVFLVEDGGEGAFYGCKLLAKGVREKDPVAMFKTAQLFLFNQIRHKSRIDGTRHATNLLQDALAGGELEAHELLGYLYQRGGVGVEADAKLAAAHFKVAEVIYGEKFPLIDLNPDDADAARLLAVTMLKEIPSAKLELARENRRRFGVCYPEAYARFRGDPQPVAATAG